MYQFEIEHWPNYFGKHTLQRLALGYVKGFLILGTIAAVSATIYYFIHFSFLYRIAQACIGVLIIAPLLPIVSFFQRNKKVPSYGINKDGFLLNERGWNAAFFKWGEIKEISLFDHPKFGKELHFEFVSYSKAINKPGQDKFTQSLAREYEIEKQPKKISNQLVKGDITDFITTFEKYFKSHKSIFLISESEAFNFAQNYLKQYCLPMEVKQNNCLFEKHAKFADEPCFVLPITHMEDCSILVSIQKRCVLGIRTLLKVDFPHLIENNLTKKEAMDKVISNLILSKNETEVSDAHFYYGGMGPFEFACWIVYTKNGNVETDYILNASTAEIVDTFTS